MDHSAANTSSSNPTTAAAAAAAFVSEEPCNKEETGAHETHLAAAAAEKPLDGTAATTDTATAATAADMPMETAPPPMKPPATSSTTRPVTTESSLRAVRVTIGEWLGKGGFSNVYAVVDMDWSDARLDQIFQERLNERQQAPTVAVITQTQQHHQQQQQGTAASTNTTTAYDPNTNNMDTNASPQKAHHRRRSLVGMLGMGKKGHKRSHTTPVPNISGSTASPSSPLPVPTNRNTTACTNSRTTAVPEQALGEKDLTTTTKVMKVQLQDFSWEQPLPTNTDPFVMKLLRPELLEACQPPKAKPKSNDNDDDDSDSGSSGHNVHQQQQKLQHAQQILELAQKDLRNEAHILSHCSHTNIVPLRSVGMDLDTNQTVLVLDRIDSTLRHYLDQEQQHYCDALLVSSTSGHTKKGTHQRAKSWFTGSSSRKTTPPTGNPPSAVSWRLRLSVLQQLASALSYLHQHQILYRDVKPDNVGLVANDGRAQLFDFGLARRIVPAQDRTQHNPNLYHLTGLTGSAKYMAPEVGLEQPYNSACDVYSFAVLLWEVLTLQTPYPKMNLHKLFQQVYHGPKIRPSLQDLERAVIMQLQTPNNNQQQHQCCYSNKDSAAAALQTLQTLLVHCWDGDWANRYSMERIETTLRQEWQRATPTTKIAPVSPTKSKPTIVCSPSSANSPSSQSNLAERNSDKTTGMPSEQQLQAMANEWTLSS